MYIDSSRDCSLTPVYLFIPPHQVILEQHRFEAVPCDRFIDRGLARPPTCRSPSGASSKERFGRRVGMRLWQSGRCAYAG